MSLYVLVNANGKFVSAFNADTQHDAFRHATIGCPPLYRIKVGANAWNYCTHMHGGGLRLQLFKYEPAKALVGGLRLAA